MSTSHFATHLPEAPKKERSYTSTPAPRRFHVVHSDEFTFVFAAFFSTAYVINSGPGSSVGIATGYGLDVPGIESR
jgi:hypothetical protein